MKFTIHYNIWKRKSAFFGVAFGVVCLSGCTAPPPGDAENTATNTTTNTTTNTITPASSSAVTKFTSSPTGLQGKLKENYVDFSFDYPASWEFQEDGRDEEAQNFVKVERSLPDKSNGEFTLENLAVGYFKHSNDPKRNAELLPKTVKILSDQFAAKLSNYKKVSEGPAKIGKYSGYEFRFQSLMKTPAKGDVQLWGRAVLLLEPNTTKGVALLMLASSLAPEIKSAADVGVKGGLPFILKSFKFGK